MNILSSGVFWGFFLIMIGLSIIIKIVFNVDIPVVRIIIGLLLIYFGVQVIFGGRSPLRRRGRVNYGERQYSEYRAKSGRNEYNVVFGTGVIDLTDIRDLSQDSFAEVNVVFGSANIFINPDIPTQVEISTVFGSAIIPGKKTPVIGQQKYRFGDNSETNKMLYLEISSVFSSVELIERRTADKEEKKGDEILQRNETEERRT